MKRKSSQARPRLMKYQALDKLLPMPWPLRLAVGHPLEQNFFQPHPQELFTLADSGQGRV